MRSKTLLTLTIVTLLAATSAKAQESAETSEAAPPEAAAQTPDASQPPEATQTPDAAQPQEADGGRFRFGIDGTVGLESVSASGAGVSGAMFGFDLRLGWQFNHMFALYAQPHLSFGSLSSSNSGAGVSAVGFTGTFITTIMGEVTFLDRFFAGAGVGYAVFNNPTGFALDFKAGGYPLMGRGANGIRRKGLMLGVDFRTAFLDGATGLLVMGCVGYESF